MPLLPPIHGRVFTSDSMVNMHGDLDANDATLSAPPTGLLGSFNGTNLGNESFNSETGLEAGRSEGIPKSVRLPFALRPTFKPAIWREAPRRR